MDFVTASEYARHRRMEPTELRFLLKYFQVPHSKVGALKVYKPEVIDLLVKDLEELRDNYTAKK